MGNGSACSFARDAGNAGREECGRRGRWCDSWEKRASDLAPRHIAPRRAQCWASLTLRCIAPRHAAPSSVLGRARVGPYRVRYWVMRMTTELAPRRAWCWGRVHDGRDRGAYRSHDHAPLLQFANHPIGQMRGNGLFGFEIRVAGRELEHALERHAGMLGYDLRGYVANAHQIVGARLH